MSNITFLKNAVDMASAEFEAAHIKLKEAEQAYSLAVKTPAGASFSAKVKTILGMNSGTATEANTALTDC